MTNFAEDPFLNPLRSCRKGEEEWGAINSGSFDPQGVGGAEETLSNFVRRPVSRFGSGEIRPTSFTSVRNVYPTFFTTGLSHE